MHPAGPTVVHLLDTLLGLHKKSEKFPRPNREAASTVRVESANARYDAECLVSCLVKLKLRQARASMLIVPRNDKKLSCRREAARLFFR